MEGEPKTFQCRQCGNCCRGEGFVRATEDEIMQMSAFLGISPEDFQSKYTRSSLFRGYWLAENPNKDCVFLEGNRCLVHPVKPTQCRIFPFGWKNLDSITTCPALKEIEQSGD